MAIPAFLNCNLHKHSKVAKTWYILVKAITYSIDGCHFLTKTSLSLNAYYLRWRSHLVPCVWNLEIPKRAGKKLKFKCRERSERKIFGKLCVFPRNSSKLRLDYLFSLQKRTDYLFQAFLRSEFLFPKSASPPPPPPPSESNGRPLTTAGGSTMVLKSSWGVFKFSGRIVFV